MIDFLQQIQTDVAAYLETATPGTWLETFHHVPVYVARPRVKADGTVEDAVMIQQTIDNALAGFEPKNGKSGLAAVVMMPEGGIPPEMVRVKGVFLEVEQIIRIIEEPLMNAGAGGVGITAEQLALQTLSALHGWQPGRYQYALRGRDKSALKPYFAPEKPGQIMWDVYLTTRRDLGTAMGADEPTITLAGTLPAVEVTLTSPDAGAGIYFTLDGSFPHAGNAAASLYEAPVSIEQACTVRACAHLAGALPSSVAEADVL